MAEDKSLEDKLRKLFLVKEEKSSAYILAQKGFNSLEEGRLKKAIQLFQQAFDKNPLKAHLGLGASYLDCDNYKAAESNFKRAIESDPENEDSHFYLSIAYLMQGRYKEAEIEVKKGRGSDPNDLPSHYALCCIYCGQGRYDEAITELAKVLKLSPNDPDAYLFLAECFMSKWVKVKKIEEFKKAWDAYLVAADLGSEEAKKRMEQIKHSAEEGLKKKQ